MAGTDCMRTCIGCGEAFTAARALYCTPSCRTRSKRKRQEARHGKRDRSRIAQCLACGVDFRSVRNGKCSQGWTVCCSHECRGKLITVRAEAMQPIVVRVLRGKCERCGRPYQKGHATRRYCSGCEGYQWQPTERQCLVCGVAFMAGKWQRVCGPDCEAQLKKTHRRTAKAKRRAVTRGRAAESIDPLRVFERDGWRCHLCGCRTPRRLRGSCEPNAPELDHVVPLALGGTHTWANVACSCRACNNAKGAKALGQLGLPLAA